MTIVEAKAAMRRRLKAWRDAVPAVEQSQAARDVAVRLTELLRSRPPGIVAGTVAIGSELDPGPALAALAARGWGLSLPVMQSRTEPLLFRRWAVGAPLVTRTWGIREPAADAPVVRPDVMLVPVLAFDTAGRRLGYGGGFYDRSLAAFAAAGAAPLTIGLGYDGQCIDVVPTLDYDRRLDHVVTPSRVLTPLA
jgi:5-formyltetrahydrofolate cyclo-ligase